MGDFLSEVKRPAAYFLFLVTRLCLFTAAGKGGEFVFQ